MNNKDFFDEEFDKMQTRDDAPSGDDAGRHFQSWRAYENPQPVKTKTNKPLYIILICVGLALCLVLGWVLCAVFGGSGGLSKDEEAKYLSSVLSSLRDSGIEITDDQWSSALSEVNKQVESGEIAAEALMSVVFKTLHNNYYKDISQDKWYAAVEKAGTALMQAAGDQFCRLMSPQTYYDYLNPQSEILSSNGKVFGVTFQLVSGVGMYVTAVITNSSSYGRLYEGDIVVKLSNVKDDKGAPLVLSVDGVPTDFSEIVTGEWDSESFKIILDKVNYATFHVLRGGSLYTYDIERGNIGYVNSNYPYEFVEFYFGDDCTNVSTEKIGNANASTKEERKLANLQDGTGYVRIVEFMDTTTGGGHKTQANKEFQSVMELFKSRGLKKLVLDLKGNPGGRVDYVCDIAGMLVTDARLPQEIKPQVNNSNGLLITTLKTRTGENEVYSRKSTYSKYFDAVGEKPDIVVWTDGGSASASELLTGALLDYGTAVHMGTRTYGKGIAQTIEPLKDYTGPIITNNLQKGTGNWAVYYTIAAYYSPLGTNIHGEGYKPVNYNNLASYDELWKAANSYFGYGSGGILTRN